MEKILQKPGKQLQYRLHFQPLPYNPQSDQHLSFLTSRIKFFHSFLRLLPVLLLLFSILFTSCSHSLSPEELPSLSVIADDITCTDITLKLKNTNPITGYRYVLTQNGLPLHRFNTLPAETTITEINLNIRTDYEYELYSEIDATRGVSSGKQIIRTLDTTSHNITWQTFTFGQYGNSVLFDVAIIDENNIWAVGEIYLNDSLGMPDNNKYNLIHWDGTSWKPERISFINGSGQSFLARMKSIFVLNPNDIWIGMDQIIIRNSSGYKSLEIPPSIFHSWINKIWGNRNDNIYIVGDNGNIAHWDGNKWTKIESGTDVDLLDVGGSPDGKVVWACGYRDFKPTVLIKIIDNKAYKEINNISNLNLYSSGKISGAIKSIWVDENNKLFVLTWFDLYATTKLKNGVAEALWRDNPFYWSSAVVRGKAQNDIFVVGVESRIHHYNGVTWRSYKSLINEQDDLTGLAVSGNIVVTVGSRYTNGIENKAILHIGRK